MIRPLERFLIVKTGGLLPNKSLEYQNKCVIDLTPGCWYYEGGNFTVRSYFDSEIRVQLANPATVNSKLEIELDMYSFYPRMLFIDGIGHGHLAMTSGREYGFELKTPSDKIEISLRDFALQPIPWQGRIIFKWSTRNSF